jgi:hypothetical protein
MYPEVTIHNIQYNQLDSLLVADAIQQNNNARWTLQTSDIVETSTTLDDTVTITALCVVPPKIIGYTANGYTMVLYDTNATNTEWGGIVVRCATGNTSPDVPGDTAQHIIDGFLAIEKGDIIRVTGRVSEFPTGNMNSLTQFQPIPGIAIDFLSSMNVPSPINKEDSVEQFYQGTYQASGPYHVQYSNGEKYEGMVVEFRNLTIINYSNVGGRNAIHMVDPEGNSIVMHDASRWFTVTGAWRDPASTWNLPPVYSVIDTIRGVLIQISGTTATFGYIIAPMFPGDVVFGVAKPTLNSHSRTPNIILQDSTFKIRARARLTQGGWPVESVAVKMSINYGEFQKYPMDMITLDSIYEASFLDLPPNSFVRYFIEASDTGGQISRLAYQGVGILGTDTALGFFNFTVLTKPPTIRDIQYSPYNHGVSPYYGATATLRGIITADSSDMVVTSHYNIYGTNAYYMQSGILPWSGIWLVSEVGDTSLGKVRRGDSISVTGTVGELNNVTQLYNILNTVTIISSNNPVPTPLTLPTSTFAIGNPTAEQYEGMLVRFVNTKVSNLAPIFSDNDLYEIDDNTGAVIIAPDGKNIFTNIPGDSTIGRTNILYLNDKVDTLTGIVYFSGGSRYAVCPRKNSDYVAGEPYQYSQGWNLVSVAREQTPGQTGYNVSRLFPTATSQPFMFAGGYLADTAIWQGVGYWLKFGSTQTIRQLGKPFALDTIEVVAGWNLVGMLGSSIAASTVDALPEGNNLSSFFGYDNGYDVATTLNPTQGYWVKSDLDGSIIMSTTGFAKSKPVDMKQFNSITITSKNGTKQTLYFGKDAEGTLNLNAY